MGEKKGDFEMNLFPNCFNKCNICGAYGMCLAGNGDDDYYPATKEQIVDRLKKGSFSSYEKDIMKKYLECLDK